MLNTICSNTLTNSGDNEVFHVIQCQAAIPIRSNRLRRHNMASVTVIFPDTPDLIYHQYSFAPQSEPGISTYRDMSRKTVELGER